MTNSITYILLDTHKRMLVSVKGLLFYIWEYYYDISSFCILTQRDGCPKIVNLGSSKTDLFYERKKYGFKKRWRKDESSVENDDSDLAKKFTFLFLIRGFLV